MQEEITNTADLQVSNLLRLTRNKTNHLINIRRIIFLVNIPFNQPLISINNGKTPALGLINAESSLSSPVP